ncbi:DUF2946 domain-containing protein [Pseudomonas cremoricolorata]|uniref:Multicopper oxidase n=1 Tax=Pseudomonas cremoricolorata TaxID=157783 RepID=A0A089WQ73_9PSED|nr:DUF2946 domain-containing protein [Pseudomonas cremoricolorata]AIR89304.1 hypothetical protein LK03_08445 [Pseudomonas cremoricolorata]
MSLSRHRHVRTTRPARRRVGGGWLSLFAMWMIFIGPLVSQSMPMNHHAGMDMAMPMDMPMASEHGHGQHAPANDGQLHVLWEKCGYCSLLFNCPALPQTVSPLTLGNLPPVIAAALAVQSGHAAQAVFPGARSRAPPQSLIV